MKIVGWITSPNSISKEKFKRIKQSKYNWEESSLVLPIYSNAKKDI